MEQITKAAEKIGLTDSKESEPEAAAPTTDAQKPSKKADKKADNKAARKEMAKAKKEADRRAAQGAQEGAKTEEVVDVSKGKYGKMELIQSKDEDRKRETRTRIATISASLDGTSIALRARVHNIRLQGSKMVFLELRQSTDTVQALLQQSNEVSKQMVKWAGSITAESIVLIRGKVQKSPIEINATTIKDAEIHIAEIHTISASAPRLPFRIEDAQRPEGEEEAFTTEGEEDAETEAASLFSGEESKKVVKVGMYTRLNNRVIDLRTVTSHAIFRIQSGACQLFREFLIQRDFVEIHTPKLLAAASEGGANVFQVTYFDGKAYLAQSPQLYKQMLITSDFDRVFEIAPVFRAENSYTHRHLTEFVGLDLEMVFEEHYHEVLELIEELFMFIFKGFESRYAKEIETVRRQFPYVKPFELPADGKVLRLTYSEGIELLRAAGEPIDDFADMNTTQEKFLGRLIKEKYHTDFYVLDKFPLEIRPFYTMPDPTNPKLSNSYDMFCRGEEIISGAQRVHDHEFLAQRIKECGIDVKGGLEDYVNAFKYGAMPHAGGGIGLERLVMLYLGIGNIRRASLFPRDPSRLRP